MAIETKIKIDKILNVNAAPEKFSPAKTVIISYENTKKNKTDGHTSNRRNINSDVKLAVYSSCDELASLAVSAKKTNETDDIAVVKTLINLIAVVYKPTK